MVLKSILKNKQNGTPENRPCMLETLGLRDLGLVMTNVWGTNLDEVPDTMDGFEEFCFQSEDLWFFSASKEKGRIFLIFLFKLEFLVFSLVFVIRFP